MIWPILCVMFAITTVVLGWYVFDLDDKNEPSSDTLVILAVLFLVSFLCLIGSAYFWYRKSVPNEVTLNYCKRIQQNLSSGDIQEIRKMYEEQSNDTFQKEVADRCEMKLMMKRKFEEFQDYLDGEEVDKEEAFEKFREFTPYLYKIQKIYPKMFDLYYRKWKQMGESFEEESYINE